MKRLLFASVSCLALLPVSAMAVRFPEATVGNEPARFSADRVDYNDREKTVVATGKVVVRKDGRTVQADKIIYRQPKQTVEAIGNVLVTESTGETLRADQLLLTEDLRQGFLEAVEIRLTDQSRLKAKKAVRNAGDRNTLTEAAYTPCKVCSGKPPLWELFARKIVHDEPRQSISYRDARLEVLGVPVAWAPYFSHPDPTVKRKTGLLSPKLGRSKEKGIILQTPVYYAIQPWRDVTFTPILMSDAGAIGVGNYRERLGKGDINLTLSGGIVEKLAGGEKTGEMSRQGHINGQARFDLNEHWRAGVDAQRVSDRVYLRRFDLDDQDTLTSRLFAERFGEQGYFRARSMTFQGLRSLDDNDRAPVILPELDYRYRSSAMPALAGGVLTLDANTLVLERRQGTDTRRLSVIGGWEKDMMTRQGSVLDVGASVQADTYYVARDNQSGLSRDDTTGRLFPQGWATVRHPFIRSGVNASQLIEPMVGIVAAPLGSNPRVLGNEDSQLLSFDDSVLFRPNRFSGRDRVEEGQRVDYGITLGQLDWHGTDTTLFLGQSMRLQDENRLYMKGSGLEDNASDIVGRLSVALSESLDITHRFRMNRSTGDIPFSESGIFWDRDGLQLALDYLSLNEQTVDDETRTLLPAQEEVSLDVASWLSPSWYLAGGLVRDLRTQNTRTASLELTWYNQCLAVSLGYERNLARESDTGQDNTIMLRLNFAHLGSDMRDYRRKLREEWLGR